MSNDELTPEEREALANLPRERSPKAGLEDRVVAAMRERGHLTRKPARVIRLTTSRVAGLLAACLVLMIGAYSIGLRHGPEALKSVAPVGTSLSTESAQDVELGVKPPAPSRELDGGRALPQSAEESPTTILSEPAARAVSRQDQPATAPPLEWKLNTPKLAAPVSDMKKEKRQKSDEVTESMTKSFSDRLSEDKDARAPAPAAAMQLQSNAVEESTAEAWRTFALNGGTLLVSAPDSLRIVTDEQGRTLLIYTSDGIIRLRLAD